MKRCLVAVLLAHFISGCMSFHTWEGLKYSMQEVERAEVVAINDVTLSLNFIGTKSIPILPYFYLKSSNAVETVVVPENSQRMDVKVLMEGIGNVGMTCVSMEDLRFATANGEEVRPFPYRLTDPFWIQEMTDCRQRNYVAIPIAMSNETGSTGVETICILTKPYFKYGSTTYYINRVKEVGFYGQVMFFLPLAVVADVVTFPVQMLLTLFVHV